LNTKTEVNVKILYFNTYCWCYC